jgi:hypothetical protein
MSYNTFCVGQAAEHICPYHRDAFWNEENCKRVLSAIDDFRIWREKLSSKFDVPYAAKH